LKDNGETLERGTGAYPAPTRDDAVTSDQWSAFPPSLSALCGHSHCCAAIPSTTTPSLSLWEPGMTRHHHPCHCRPSGLPSATPSSRRMDDDSSGRRPHNHPRSRSWAGTGLTTTLARSEIRHNDQQLHDIVYHTAICSLEPCDAIVNRLPLVYKGGGDPLAAGGRIAAYLHTFRLHHDIGTLPQSNLRDLETSPPLSKTLVTSLCKHYGATQYSA
jgi:hypothetical protein